MAKYAAERLEGAAGEEPFCADLAGLQTLWALLRVVAQFQVGAGLALAWWRATAWATQGRSAGRKEGQAGPQPGPAAEPHTVEGRACPQQRPPASSAAPARPASLRLPQGNLKSAPYGRQLPARDEAGGPEAALAAALLDPFGAAAVSGASPAANAPSPVASAGALAPSNPEAAAARVQELLLAGSRAEALRWVGLLGE